MHPLIGVLAVGLTDPRLVVGIALLLLTLVLVRVRALLRQPQQPQRAPRRSDRGRVRDSIRRRTERASN